MSIKSQTTIELKPYSLTISTDAYADKDVFAAAFEVKLDSMSGLVGAKLLEVCVIDIDDIGVALDLLCFNTEILPPGNNEPLTLEDAEWAYYIGTIRIATDDYTSYSGVKVANVAVNRPFGSAFWVVPVARSVGDFATANGGVKLWLKFESEQ